MSNCSDCPNPVGARRPNLESVMKLAEEFPESSVCLSMPRGQQPFLKVDSGPDTPVMAYTLDDVTDVAGIPMCGGPTLKDAGARAEAGLSAFAAAKREVDEKQWVHDDDEGGRLKLGMKGNLYDYNDHGAWKREVQGKERDVPMRYRSEPEHEIIEKRMRDRAELERKNFEKRMRDRALAEHMHGHAHI